ncbi:hypothetical protein EV424DRAFT_1441759, partial [Suillus variegatus]
MNWIAALLFFGISANFILLFLDTSCVFRDDVNHVEAVHGAYLHDLHPLSLTFFLGHLLNQVCSLHGLALGHSHSVIKLCSLLLQHFLHGECLASDTRSKHRDYTACYMLMSADTSAISSDDLWTVAQSIC